MKYMMLCLLFYYQACTRTVYSLEVSEEVREEIAQEIQMECGEQCFLDKCWMETKDAMICNVYFSFVSLEEQIEALTNIAKRLNDDGIKSEFCGDDSPGASVTSFFARSLVGLSSDISANVTSLPSNQRLKLACQDTSHLVDK